eukprot:3782840-Prymnesium_polylepis.1
MIFGAVLVVTFVPEPTETSLDPSELRSLFDDSAWPAVGLVGTALLAVAVVPSALLSTLRPETRTGPSGGSGRTGTAHSPISVLPLPARAARTPHHGASAAWPTRTAPLFATVSPPLTLTRGATLQAWHSACSAASRARSR